MCDSGKGESICEGNKKEQSARKISRCARNDSVGDGYPLYRIKCALEKCSSRIVIPSGAEGSFSLAVRGRVSDSEERETPPRRKGSEACLNAIYLFISIARHAFLIIIYFSNLEY